MKKSRTWTCGALHSVTLRKMPCSRNMSWSSSQVPELYWYTSTATVFLPGLRYRVMSNSAALRLLTLKPTCSPLSQRKNAESTPSNVRKWRRPAHSAGTSKSRR